MGYGFSVRNNPRDSYLLRIGIHQKGPLEAVRKRQSELYGNNYSIMEAGGRDVYTLYSPSRSYCKGYKHTIPEFRAFPQAMLDDVSVLVANQRELDTIGFSDEGFWLAGHGAHSRNDYSAMSHLLRTLRHRRRRILCNDSKLPRWPQNERQFYAARYRRGQLQILNEIIHSLENRLNKALTSDYDGPLGELLDLKQIIYRSPDSLRLRFQAALDAAFGTHKPSLLKKSGWEDAVIALWICTLWITQKAQGGIIHDRLGMGRKLSNWIDFMLEHYPADKSDAAYIAAVCHNVDDDNTPHPHRNGDGNGTPVAPNHEDENQKRLIVYTEEITHMITAAAARDPHGVFAHHLWCGDLVRWGFKILNAEAVSVPARDEASDDDRLALFLAQRRVEGEGGLESSSGEDEGDDDSNGDGGGS